MPPIRKIEESVFYSLRIGDSISRFSLFFGTAAKPFRKMIVKERQLYEQAKS